MQHLESDITCLIVKQESELALGVNNAAYHGDLHRLKGLINSGADPCKTDYNGRTALVLSYLFPNQFYTTFLCWRLLANIIYNQFYKILVFTFRTHIYIYGNSNVSLSTLKT